MSRMIRGLAVAGLLLSVACGNKTSPQTQSTPKAEETPSTNSAPVSGTSMTTSASCVEQYTLDNLKKRAFAFDGTIKAVEVATTDGPDQVTFAVTEWFKGGSGAETIRQAYSFGAVTSAGGSPHQTGERLLVAGDEDFIWECGFTQPYDAGVAADWKSALAGS